MQPSECSTASANLSPIIYAHLTKCLAINFEDRVPAYEQLAFDAVKVEIILTSAHTSCRDNFSLHTKVSSILHYFQE